MTATITLKEAVGTVLEGWTLPDDVRKILEQAYWSDSAPQAVHQGGRVQHRLAFETWAVKILGDNPRWRESGDCELAWQAWMAATAHVAQQAK